MRKNFPLAVVTAAVLALALHGCGRESDEPDEGDGLAGPSAVLPQATPAPTATPAPAATPAPTPVPSPTPGATAVSYEPDVKAVLDARCARCHSSLTTYRGTLTYVRPGDASSLLVEATGPGGAMGRYLSSAEAEVLRQWVLAGAPERR